jgi:bifunctional non-homologous end joining protein LigD
VPTEQRVDVDVEGRRLTLTNLQKEMYPGFTKAHVIDYYTRIAPVMLAHVADRPLTLHRFVNGTGAPGFYEKHVPSHAPDWFRTVEVPSTSSESGTVVYAVVTDLASIVWLANLACLEFHVPLWHVGRRRHVPAPPDFIVFDLDPGAGTAIAECCTVALWAREVLEARHLEAFPKTSGSKGVQVYAPVAKRTSWERSRAMALELAQAIERAHPELVVTNMRKERRKGRVLIDWSQNHPAKTTVAAYSLRARPQPSVSTPLAWAEVERGAAGGDIDALSFTPEQVLARVAADGDLFVR